MTSLPLFQGAKVNDKFHPEILILYVLTMYPRSIFQNRFIAMTYEK